jgi:hypothetical protein
MSKDLNADGKQRVNGKLDVELGGDLSEGFHGFEGFGICGSLSG